MRDTIYKMITDIWRGKFCIHEDQSASEWTSGANTPLLLLHSPAVELTEEQKKHIIVKMI